MSEAYRHILVMPLVFPYNENPVSQMGRHGVCRYESSGMCRRARRAIVSIEFLITTLIIVATPGTGVIYTLALPGSGAMIATSACSLPNTICSRNARITTAP